MATTNVTVRMDENLKKQFDSVCDEKGLSKSIVLLQFLLRKL
ncbi:MAG: type II toxin-antitoxin system RelB/DinJ family antitoxin [Thermoguttaceae bacterium]